MPKRSNDESSDQGKVKRMRDSDVESSLGSLLGEGAGHKEESMMGKRQTLAGGYRSLPASNPPYSWGLSHSSLPPSLPPPLIPTREPP